MVLMNSIQQLTCPECGYVFYWKIKDKESNMIVCPDCGDRCIMKIRFNLKEVSGDEE